MTSGVHSEMALTPDERRNVPGRFTFQPLWWRELLQRLRQRCVSARKNGNERESPMRSSHLNKAFSFPRSCLSCIHSWHDSTRPRFVPRSFQRNLTDAVVCNGLVFTEDGRWRCNAKRKPPSCRRVSIGFAWFFLCEAAFRKWAAWMQETRMVLWVFVEIPRPYLSIPRGFRHSWPFLSSLTSFFVTSCSNWQLKLTLWSATNGDWFARPKFLKLERKIQGIDF